MYWKVSHPEEEKVRRYACLGSAGKWPTDTYAELARVNTQRLDNEGPCQGLVLMIQQTLKWIRMALQTSFYVLLEGRL